MRGILKSSQADLLSFILEAIGGQHFDVIVLSTVREDDPQMQEALSKKCGRLVVVESGMKLPVDMEFGFPAKGLGADRLAAALAVAMLFPGKDCIKFDFGTALTVDFINKGKIFSGGNISLGMQSRFRALNTFTKRLPMVKPEGEIKDISYFVKMGSILKTDIDSKSVLIEATDLDEYLEIRPLISRSLLLLADASTICPSLRRRYSFLFLDNPKPVRHG